MPPAESGDGGLGTDQDDAGWEGLVPGCGCGVDVRAARMSRVMRSRFEARGSEGGVEAVEARSRVGIEVRMVSSGRVEGAQ